MSAAGGAPSLGAAFQRGSGPAFQSGSGPAPGFGGGAFGGGANGPSQTPNPFQPAPFTAGGAGAFGQQQSAPTGFGATATNTAGAYAQYDLCLVHVQAGCFDQPYSFHSLVSRIHPVVNSVCI